MRKRLCVNANWIKQALTLGIELRPSNKELVLKLFESGAINHAQVSVPAGWHPRELDRFTERVPLVFHSTFLNTIGNNDWPLLKKAAHRLSSYRPIAVVEHFGTLKDQRGRKYAVHYPTKGMTRSSMQRSVANLKRWQDLLNCEVAIENIPVTSGFSQYLNDFREIVAASGVTKAIDLPHLLISCASEGLPISSVIKILRELDPEQVHTSGLGLSADRVEDNHRQITPWILTLLEKANINPRHITIEQSQELPAKYIETTIRSLQKKGPSPIPFDKLPLRTRGSREFSDDLAQERSKSFGHKYTIRSRSHRVSGLVHPLLRLVERNYPFFYPLASLQASGPRLSIEDAIEVTSHTLKIFNSFAAWYDHPQPKFFFRVESAVGTMCIDFEEERIVRRIPIKAQQNFRLSTDEGATISIFSSVERRNHNETV